MTRQRQCTKGTGCVTLCKALNSLSLHFLICKVGFIITVMTTEAMR